MKADGLTPLTASFDIIAESNAKAKNLNLASLIDSSFVVSEPLGPGNVSSETLAMRYRFRQNTLDLNYLSCSFTGAIL